MNTKNLIVAVMSLSLIFSFNQTLSADEVKHHEHATPHSTETGAAPETLPAIWHEIKDHEHELGEIIKAGKLAEVHEMAFKIRDLAKALAAKSSDLPQEQKDRLASSVERISEVASMLDRYGDAGDQANTESEFARLNKLLNFVAMQYPEGALSTEKEEHHHDEGHSEME